MKQSDSLFMLIKSLSKNEKGYFKKSAAKSAKGEKNIYTHLFNIIEKQKHYNEVKVKEKIKKYAGEVDLSIHKNYLYDVILKSLRSYHNELSVDTRLRDQLKNAEILYKKNLFSDCESELKKAMALAQKYQRHTVLLDIYVMLFQLTFVSTNVDDYQKFSGQYFKEQTAIIKTYSDLVHYRMLSAKLRHFTSLNSITDASLQELFRSDFLKEQTTFSSYKAGLQYYNTLCYIYKTFNVSEQFYTYSSKYIEFMETDEALMEEELEHYIFALNYLLISQIQLQKYKEFETTLKVFKKIRVKFPVWEINSIQAEWNIRLYYYIKTAQFNSGIEFLKEQESIFLQHETAMSDNFRICIYDSIAILYFIRGDFSNALKWVNKILLTKWRSNYDVQCFSHLLFLMIQWEKENYELIEHTYNRSYRFITKHLGKDGLEIILLNFLRKATPSNNRKEQVEAFEILRQKALNHQPAPNHPPIFDLFDPLVWIESKLQGVPMELLLVNAGSKKD